MHSIFIDIAIFMAGGLCGGIYTHLTTHKYPV